MCSPLIFGAALPVEMEELLVARLAGTDELSVLVDMSEFRLFMKCRAFRIKVPTVGSISHALVPKLTFRCNFHMVLHGFASRKLKHITFHQKALYLYKNQVGTQQIQKQINEKSR